jgi:opacity protein-like surface antigen
MARVFFLLLVGYIFAVSIVATAAAVAVVVDVDVVVNNDNDTGRIGIQQSDITVLSRSWTDPHLFHAADLTLVVGSLDLQRTRVAWRSRPGLSTRGQDPNMDIYVYIL